MPDPEPLVSIGLPVRNAAGTVAEVAASVLGQRYGNLEFVIYDNASTDGTESVCRDLARADERVVYRRHSENVGLLNNFVATMNAARGTYFRWIGDSDDIEPDLVGRCLATFAADPRVVLVTTGMAYTTNDGLIRSEPYTGTGLASDDPADRVIEMLRLLNESYLQLDPLYAMMRRETVVAIPRHNMLREDQIFAVKLALAGPWAHVPDVLARRNWTTGPTLAQARRLGVPSWRSKFANSLQLRELLMVVRDADLTTEQRARARAAVYRMFLRRHRRTIRHRSRKLLRLGR
jgi:glycosyltransferase involved in cell wall biosynthesis